MKRKRKVTVSGTPDGFTGSVDAHLRQTENKRSPDANVIVAGSGPAQWNRFSGAASSFPALAPQQFQMPVQPSPQTVRNVSVQSNPRVSYNPPTSTAGQHGYVSNFPNMTPGYDYGSPRMGYMVPEPPPITGTPHPDIKIQDTITTPSEPTPEPAPPEGGTTGAPPFMAPSIWLLQDPDATGDQLTAAKEGKEPWFGVLVSDGNETMAFEEFAEMSGMPPAQVWAMWNQYFSHSRPEMTGREGTDYWSTGVPFTSTMGTDQMLETINQAQGEDMLDTYSMVQNDPNVFSYPYRDEDPNGEWQPGFGQPVNPIMGQRPVPREIPYYDQRGLLEAQILDEMAMRGIPPAVTLDAAGYNPRDQHLYSNTPVGRVDPNVVLINILKRIRGMQ